MKDPKRSLCMTYIQKKEKKVRQRTEGEMLVILAILRKMLPNIPELFLKLDYIRDHTLVLAVPSEDCQAPMGC